MLVTILPKAKEGKSCEGFSRPDSNAESSEADVIPAFKRT